MPEPERSRVMAIRTGERTFEETIAEIDEVERRLAAALERTVLPPEPDRAAVDRFLVEAYRRAWGWYATEDAPPLSRPGGADRKEAPTMVSTHRDDEFSF
jgi:hypothetical protein